jgi:hypothetical protein
MDHMGACASYDGKLLKNIMREDPDVINWLEWHGVGFLSWLFLAHSWEDFKENAT